jgi:hypothetical protein
MLQDSIEVRCPVGNNILGYRNKKENCTFLCNDCEFLYTWNKNGELLFPQKHIKGKIQARCDCASCQYRDKLTK